MALLSNLRTFESLGIRGFRYLWLGQVSTALGQWMDQVSRTWLIYSMTHSPMQLGLVSAARGMPMLFFGVVAGVAADRYGTRLQLIIAQTVNALLNFALAFLILTGRVELWHIYLTAFMAGTVQAFQQPARQVMISDLVGEKHLLNAISLNAAAVNASRGVGPAIAGLVINAGGVGISYVIQAAIYVMATIWTFQIKLPESRGRPAVPAPQERQDFVGSAMAGLKHILAHRLVLALMLLGLAPAVLGMPFLSLMPVFAIDVFQGNAGTQGVLLSMVGLGSVAGALAMASFGTPGRGKALIVAAVVFGLSLIAFSQSPIFIMAAVFALIAGFSHSSYSAQNQTILQMITPREIRGRVLGIYLLDRGLTPLGSLLAGALATLFGGPWAVTIMGVSCLILTLWVGAMVPAVRRLNLAWK